MAFRHLTEFNVRFLPFGDSTSLVLGRRRKQRQRLIPGCLDRPERIAAFERQGRQNASALANWTNDAAGTSERRHIIIDAFEGLVHACRDKRMLTTKSYYDNYAKRFGWRSFKNVSQRPTLHDVSAAAKVSIYTVSKALSGGEGVSKATRKRVQDIAAQIGYVPNLHARSLKSPQSTAVAVLTANIANQYYSVLVSSIESAIEDDGYDCITMDAMMNGAYSQSREDRFVASIMTQRVAAVVVTYNLSDANMRALAGWGIPLIFVDCPTPQGFEQYSSVTTDSYLGSFEMGMHLAGHGYKRWAFVGHTGTWSTRQPRQKGFEAAAVETGCIVDVLEGLNSSATSKEAVSRLFMERPRLEWPEVFYASNTVLLHGIFQALRSFSLSIPGDIAVVAFDDFEWAEMLDPPVTVVDQDITTIGRAAGMFLLRALRGQDQSKGETFVLKPSLRIRQSCGCGMSHRSGTK